MSLKQPRNSVEGLKHSSQISKALHSHDTKLTSRRPSMRMFPILSIAQICVPSSPIPFLRLHLLVDEVECVNMTGEVSKERETDITDGTKIS